MAGSFREADAALVTVDGSTLKTRLQVQAPRRQLYVGIADILLTRWISRRTAWIGVRLDRLTEVSYGYNERRRWFDLADRDGSWLRLQFPLGDLTDEESAVMATLRDHVVAYGPIVDPYTRRALGISDYQPVAPRTAATPVGGTLPGKRSRRSGRSGGRR
ncbi:MAG TPA: hypothetical protein VMD59_14365 [Acidimicrobiales bacterium]|nr:hypothetical protein [Acidimicrobiales bacterium]